MANSWLEMFGWELKRKSSDNPATVAAGYIAPQNENAAFTVGEGYYGSYAYQLSFDQNITDDFALIHKYRQVALHPEVDRAINEIVNEAIDGTTEEKPAKLNLDDLKQPDSIKDKIQEQFDKILELMDFNEESYEIFRKWYVDGRMYYHMIIDKDNTKDGIQELRYISPLHIKKMREEKTELKNGVPIVVSSEDYFVYSRDLKNTSTPGTGGIKITTDSIAYCTSGLVDEVRNLVYSYLQRSTRTCNQLRMEEDALVIYRLARAPERRAFYIDVGNMPKGKAEEHVRAVQARFKNKMIYDSTTGEVKDSLNNLSMLEDYWIPRREGGTATEIVPIAGGANLGEIADIEYFRKKLFESMGVPLGRLMSDQSSPFTIGQSQLITREEVTFAAFIDRLRKRFANIFKTILRMQLILTNVISIDEWEEIKEHIKVDFASNTYFEELKNNEILRERMTTLTMIDPGPYIGRYFSKAWARKNILKFDDETIKQMKKEMKDEEGEDDEFMAKQAAAMMPPEEGEPAPPPSDPTSLLPTGPNDPADAPAFNTSNFGGGPKKPKKPPA